MSHAHVCDNCMTVAPLDEAIGWWKLESIEGYVHMGEKEEYHYCSKKCAVDHLAAEQARMTAQT